MRKICLILSFTCILCITGGAMFGQSTDSKCDVVNSDSCFLSTIEISIGNGNVTELIKYCTNHIDLALPDKSGIYSQSQSSMILSNFFKSHPPKSFKIEQKNNLNTELFLVGHLNTNSGVYRVILQTKKIEQKPYIYQIRIEN